MNLSEDSAKIVVTLFEDFWDTDESFQENIQRFLDALSDGEFLSRNDWDEEDVNDAYTFLENLKYASKSQVYALRKQFVKNFFKQSVKIP